MKSATQKKKNWKEFDNTRWSWWPRRKRLKPDLKQQSKRGNVARLQRERPRWSPKEDWMLNKRTPSQLKRLMKLKCNVKPRSSDAKRNVRQHKKSS